ncbi:MAG: winged helix-turn-helix domain-containing protein [Nitrososphaeraceae archaeon]
MQEEDRLNIISLILEISSNNSHSTEKTTIPIIMYNTLLNHTRLNVYWTALNEVGLLDYETASQTFKTTEKGLRVIEVFSKLDQQSREEREMKNYNNNTV